MIDDLVDEVDEQDNPTGQKLSMERAHELRRIHRVSAIIVFLPNGKIIVQAHKDFDRRLDHSVGGHVDSGEDYLTAANREMQEELGMKAPLKLIDIVKPGNSYFDKYDKDIRHNYAVYVARAPKDWQFTPNDEVDQVSEMTLEELVAKANQEPEAFLTGFLITLAAYLRYANSPLKITAFDFDWSKI